MSDLNISLMTALLDFGNGIFQTKAAFWPEWDALVNLPEEAEQRGNVYFQYIATKLRSEKSGLEEFFLRQPNWHFENEDPSKTTKIESLRVYCPVWVDRKKKESVKVPFDLFVSLPSLPTEKRTVWFPLRNCIFTIPAEGDPVPPIVEDIGRIIARELLEEDPKFLDFALQVVKTDGYLFHHRISFKQEDSDEIQFCSPKTLGMRPISAEKIPSKSVYGFHREVEQMIEAFDQPIPNSILLLGPPGSGKTTLWRAFIVQGAKTRLFEQFWEADAVLLAGLENPPEKIEELGRWVVSQKEKEEKAVFHLGNLWEIDQTGKGFMHNISLADILMPMINRGTLPTVIECTPEQYADLDRNHPAILMPFQVISIPDTTPEQNFNILKTMNQTLCGGAFSTSGLSRLESMLRRYSPYEAVPGAAVSFMGQPTFLSRKKGSIGEHEVAKVFAEQSGLPLFLLDPEVKLDRKATCQFFFSRVMGQGGDEPATDSGNNKASEIFAEENPGAVPILLDLIEAVKERVTKSDGPIASLLFIGPTGVGKTELAKTLAEFFYGSPKKMVRIDMNEFGEYGAADRLVNGSVNGGGILTSAVRAQPFGVVLLDEFEKAHASVFDLLLQILGEGRLTDSLGRTADFRNSVIILTSNLGMERYGKKSLGFDHGSGSFSDVEHFTREVAQLVRPEMLNRIDRIVPFRPLSRETLRRILDRELSLLMKRQGIAAHRLTLEIDDAVKEELVRLGYDPRYGARPLRRTLERELLLPLAELLVGQPLDKPLFVRFLWKNGKIEAKAQSSTGKALHKVDQDQKERIDTIFRSWSLLSEEIERLGNSAPIVSLKNAVHCRRQKRAGLEEHHQKNGESWRVYQELEKDEAEFREKEEWFTRIERLREEIFTQEAAEAVLWMDGQPFESNVETFGEKTEQFKREFYLWNHPDQKDPNFWFQSSHRDYLFFFVRLVDEFCRKNGEHPEFWFSRENPTGRLRADAPELTSPRDLYPWGIVWASDREENVTKSKGGIDVRSIMEKVRCEKIYPLQFQKAERLTTFWKMDRDRNGLLNWQEPRSRTPGNFQILMTGITDPFLRHLFWKLCGTFPGQYGNESFDLRMNLFPVSPLKWEPQASEEICSWEFMVKSPEKSLFPWKYATPKFVDETKLTPYDLETGKFFPDELFFRAYNTFFSPAIQ